MRPHLPATGSLTALLLCAGAAPAWSQAPTTAQLTAITDKVFAPWNSTHSPGCAVGIARGGTTLLERGYGMADLAGGRPITPGTILESGSVAKQFTATAVMLLVADGKLRLEDDARSYLPELPTYGRPITVRHLLTHTSGLREWSNLVAWQGWPRGTRVHTQGDAFRIITSQRALNYPVGDHYSYTNSGYLLARTLVERVSGQDFETFTAQRIFAPLGLTHTSWRGNFTRIVPGLAQAYRRTRGEWQLDMPNDHVIAAGGLWTTVGDWLAWNEHLTKRTLGAAVVDSLSRRMRLTNGIDIGYALGLMVGEYRGTAQIAHSGSTAGYSTYLARYPQLGNLSIAVLCNSAGAPATNYTHAIVDALHPELARPAARDTVAADLASLLPWRGLYEDTRWHSVAIMDTVSGTMRLDGAPVRPLRDGTYLIGSQVMRLAMDADGRTRTLRTVTSDGDSVVHRWRQAERWRPGLAELQSLAGRYTSDEIGVTFVVAVQNGTLTVSSRPGVVDTLTPTARDAFDGSDNAVWFTRGRNNTGREMHFGASRVWHFTAGRVP
ncbi:serine hydrolase domain-containing protein [Gemmatimonas sp.]|uniref:serine hydrolase domain-containing protein n=2 Tax=Gemmatimonas sp. TaxID=1962908 RepID=UPI00391F6BBA